MAADEASLLRNYELVKLNVASGTQVSTRTADVINNLSKTSSAGEPIIVSLTTRSRNANKLISIVEIAKRELKGRDISGFQYNALSSETVQIERKQKPPNGTAASPTNAEENDEDVSDDAFEAMGEKVADGPKQRVIPVMTTYLSTTSINELKARYG